MSKENPTSFSDLDVEVLRKTAIEDFAVPVKADANKKTVLAALLEDGVEWEQYATLKGLIQPEPVVVPSTVATPTPVVPEPEEEVEIVTATPITQGATVSQKYLLKMDRDNVRFDIRGHKFTAEHPYALVSADDADYILTNEKGFRMAMPRELEEFYG